MAVLAARVSAARPATYGRARWLKGVVGLPQTPFGVVSRDVLASILSVGCAHASLLAIQPDEDGAIPDASGDRSDRRGRP